MFSFREVLNPFVIMGMQAQAAELTLQKEVLVCVLDTYCTAVILATLESIKSRIYNLRVRLSHFIKIFMQETCKSDFNWAISVLLSCYFISIVIFFQKYDETLKVCYCIILASRIRAKIFSSRKWAKFFEAK